VLKMLADIDEPDDGAIVNGDLTIGYLPQDGLTHAGGACSKRQQRVFSRCST